jgi:hypothetical protein
MPAQAGRSVSIVACTGAVLCGGHCFAEEGREGRCRAERVRVEGVAPAIAAATQLLTEGEPLV